MISFWTCWLKTPMAAPETAALKRLRISILVLCSLTVPGVLFIKSIEAAIGRAAGGLVAGIMVTLVVVAAVYTLRKTRADTAFLDVQTRERAK